MLGKPIFVLLAAAILFAAGCFVVTSFHTRIIPVDLIFAFLFCLFTMMCLRDIIWPEYRHPSKPPPPVLAFLFCAISTAMIFVRAAGFNIPNWLLAAQVLIAIGIALRVRRQSAMPLKNPDTLQLCLMQKDPGKKS